MALIDTFAPFRAALADLSSLPEERRKAKAQEQQGELRGLQIEQAKGSLADLTQQRDEKVGLQTAIAEGQKAGKSSEQSAANYYKTIGRPEKAQEIFNSVLDTTSQLADLDPARAEAFFKEKIGGDLKLRGKKGKVIELESPGSGEILIYDTEQRKVVDRVKVSEKETKPTTLQQNLIGAGLKPGTPEFQQAILSSVQKPGQSFRVDSEGNIELLSGPGAGKQQKTTKKGFEFVDKEFAKDFVEWRVRGGSADAFKQIDQLEQALDNLESGQNLTGPIAGLTPNIALNIFNSEAINTEELVTEVVQRNLRVVLGAQFTEKEGERLIKRAYNRNLEEAVNAKRVKRLLNQIKLSAKAKDDASDFFTENGTLEGYSGNLPTFADFEEIDFDAISVSEEITATNPETGEKVVLQNGEWVKQ